jgi:hypothetical protein
LSNLGRQCFTYSHLLPGMGGKVAGAMERIFS